MSAKKKPAAQPKPAAKPRKRSAVPPVPQPQPKRTNRTAKKTSAPDWGPNFLNHLRDTANICEACKMANVGRSTVYDRRDREEAFAAAMAATLTLATEDVVERLERSALERALAGDTALTIFLLKAGRPEKYRERYEVKHEGGVRLEIVEEIIDAGAKPEG